MIRRSEWQMTGPLVWALLLTVAECMQVLTGGKLIKDGAGGQFYAPTVLVGVTPSMRIWREEVFGPVMVIVKCSRDDEAVRMANDCPFGLGSAVFSRSTAHARSIGARLEVRMHKSHMQDTQNLPRIDGSPGCWNTASLTLNM